MKAKLTSIMTIDAKGTGWAARQERWKADLTLRGMAKIMGISAVYLSDLERGQRPWGPKMIERFNRAIANRRK